MNLTQHQAEVAVSAGRRAADDLGIPMNIALLDAGAHLKSFVRMDGALIGSIEIAQSKARTAVLFGMRTEALFEFCKPGGTSPSLDRTNGGLIVFAGGIPLYCPEGNLLGAVGVSGGAVADDLVVAEAAADAVGELYTLNGSE